MATDRPVPAQFALQSIMEGLSARAGLREFRAAGGRVANETWFKLRGQLEAMVALKEGVYDEPVNLKPTSTQIQDWTTARAKGYIQQVEVLARDKATGEIISIPYSLAGKRLVSRRTTIKRALETYSRPGKSGEGQVILGAVYTGTYRLTPEIEQ